MQVKTRAEMPDETKWKLEDIYKDDAGWEADFARAKTMVDALPQYAGTLTSAENIAKAIAADQGAARLIEKLHVYARMSRDGDGADALYQGMSDRTINLSVQYGANTSYFVPELLALPAEQFEAFKASEALKSYAFMLKNIERARPHTLGADCEQLLAMTGEMAEAPSEVFSMLDDADMRFGTVNTPDGDIELTSSSYIVCMQSQNRDVRQQAFTKLYDTYTNFKNTYGTLLSSSVKGDVFYAKARNYPSALEAALFSNNVPVSVYDSLIEAVHEYLPAMYKYLGLRKKLMGLDELHMYDVYAPLGVDDFKFPYEKACQLVLEGTAPLGEDYTEMLKKAFASGWIDVYENRGKRSGAYSWGSYDTHPYVLLNYKTTLNDVFTIAHELGHAMHSYYSDGANPYHLAQYSIFTAEVASTVNEALMQAYLYNKETDPGKKLRLLTSYLEQFRTTLFRQVMFAEFEKWTHAQAEAGSPLTAEAMKEYYYGLNKLYYGEGVVSDEHIGMEWARIPHFYTAFYVYKYATGFASAVKLSSDILGGTVGPYREFLKSGGTDYPIEQLKRAGVDLTTPAPVTGALEVFSKYVDELEKLI